MLSLHQKTSPGPVDVTFQNVSYEVQKTEKKFPFSRKKTTLKILHNVSGYVPGGSSLAILGPSGSGKTSLLNLLAARSEKPPTSGTILFSGRPRVPRTKRQIGYVMQDDVFFSKLTVRETLMFTADVRLPRTMTREQRTQRVDNVIKMLGLENCQNTRIGDQQFDKGISGGERKRVNIANELIHKPSLLLADECTSGLDSSSALSVINVLSQLCNEGHTVISTIHQPSSRMFFLFSRILILAEGRVAYFGAPNNVVSYLESLDFPFPGTAYNPADFALELVIDNEEKNGMPSPQQRIVCAWKTSRVDWISADSMQSPEHIELPMDYLCNQTKIHPEEGNVSDSTDPTTSIGQTDLSEPTMKPISTYRERMKRAVCKRFRQLMRRQDEFEEEKYTTSWWTQTAALAKRALRQKQGMLFRFIGLLQVFITTVLVLMFWFRSPPEESTVEDRFGLLSFININWAFYSISTAVFTFPKEKAVLTKDRASGIYRLSAYYFAKTIVEMPADMLYPLFFGVVIYYGVNMNPDIRAFILFNLIVVLNVLVGQSIGLFLSCAMMNVQQAQVVGSSWVLISIMTSGYLINPDNVPDAFKFIRYLNFLRYAYEALVQTEMSFGRTYECDSNTIYSGNGAKCPIDKDNLLDGAQLRNVIPIWGCLCVQILWIISFRIFGYFALKTLHTTHKPKLSTWKAQKL